MASNAKIAQVRLEANDALARPLREGRLGDFEAGSDLAACLMPFLHALGWRRDLREIAESLPHFANSLGIGDFRNVLARLGYCTSRLKHLRGAPDSRLVPFLMIRPDGSAAVVLECDGTRVRLFDGRQNQEQNVRPTDLAGAFYVVDQAEELNADISARQDNWLGDLMRRFRRPLAILLATSFLLNMLALLVPLFVMTVYDRVIPTKSGDVLYYLVLGMLAALVIEAGLRLIRARLVASLAGRIEFLVASTAFHKLMGLPASLTETAPLGNQVARLKEFDAIRELFTGPLVSVALEAPFVVIFLAAIAALAGPLALIPVIMMLVFLLVTAVLRPRLRRAVKRSSQARARRHSFLMETITNLRTVRESNAENIWLKRFRDLSAEASYLHFKTGRITFLFQALSQTLMMAAGIATVAFGVLRVLDDAMTIGALIATMALVWRVLSPLNNLFLTIARLEQIKISTRQINQLMRMPVETDRKAVKAGVARRKFAGALAFGRVSFRYGPDSEPALLGVNFRAAPGEMIAITGPNGAGKTSILKLVLGLYRPQAGQVAVDRLDIRQINPAELRQAIAYVPQRDAFFHGTIGQNLRLAQPTGSTEELEAACDLAGVLGEVQDLKDGLQSRLGDQNTRHLSSGFLQRLALARAYLKRAPILLLDEAAQTLDEAGDAQFIKTITKIKGSSTIIMVTHRPSHMRLADRLLVFNSGVLLMDGKPDEVLEKMPKGL